MRKSYPILFLLIGVVGGFIASKAYTKNEKVYKKIELLMEVIKMASENYVRDIGEEELILDAIKGMLFSLDPFSAYLTPRDFTEMQVETKGQFGGIGIEITKKDYYILVISPIEDTPAWRAGILPGDRIIKINDESTRNMSIQDAVQKLRGPKGTKVKITIERDSWAEPKEIELVRDIIKIKSVRAKVLDNILYVRLMSFQEKSSDDLKKTFRESGLYDGKIKGVIFDLRNNPGGLLSEAIKIGDLFLSSGTIVSTKGRTKKDEYKAQKDKYDFPENVSLIVLVNRGSASASEIVVGAIKDNKKGILVGERTFGKGSVQTIIPLSEGALRITTAHYYTPSGTNINEKGIEPDIKFKDKKIEEPTQEEILRMREHPEEDPMVKFAISLINGNK